ncbi:MAG: hypothetical protein MK066_11980 [Crocinitomicaceae bacterium]|nr:hypothetical protein [Crocinitomicaceae bacterium]
MSFNGTEGGIITLSKGSSYTAEYRAQNEGETIAHFFGREVLERLLADESAMGIRVYYGINPKTQAKELVLVGADAAENDLINGPIADLSLPSPPNSGNANTLNS